MAFRIELDEQPAIKAINRVAQEYRKDTKATVKARRIWRTGDLWAGVDILQIARKVGSQIFAVLGINNAKLRHAKSKGGESYPSAVHDGSKPYTINPGAKGFLAFQKGGKWVYTKKPVHIPARKGRPFFDWTYKAKEDKYDKIISDGIKLK